MAAFRVQGVTIEIDEALLERAGRALGGKTTGATVEEALRPVQAPARPPQPAARSSAAASSSAAAR